MIKETQQGTLFNSNAISAVVDIGNLSRRTQFSKAVMASYIAHRGNQQIALLIYLPPSSVYYCVKSGFIYLVNLLCHDLVDQAAFCA